MIRIAVHGAAGRMGRRLMALIAQSDDLQLVGAVDRVEHLPSDEEAAALCIQAGVSTGQFQDTVPKQAEAAIDFSSVAGTRRVLEQCAADRIPLVIGTTGLNAQDHLAIDHAAESIPILQAPNMSLGINLMMILVGRAAQMLGDDYDTEILETHHRFKKDAPSGTALGLASAICKATGKDLANDVCYGQYGPDPGDAPRERGRIGMHAVRMGDVVGEHAVSFSALGERLEVKHIATDRDVFAHGALAAARWLVNQPPGRYGMEDVLGL